MEEQMKTWEKNKRGKFINKPNSVCIGKFEKSSKASNIFSEMGGLILQYKTTLS